ncbi:signal transduction histidine kinase [Sphingomonas jejuensis]|uniref:histidine kinase n=1 Tax=Sphingomonas jejuensis TaxID=904715 RepID=A0ABX0XRA4_9SPHN|nr:HAMP domain-containing sensor histidine kinase [Sphingomonas jejuensis]NJC35226.1 signal transduction histidine kinase [Sphingomonas jejuensis]
MGSSGRPPVGLAVRTVLLGAAMLLAVAATQAEGLVVSRIVAWGLVAIAAGALWHHVTRTNRELARFVEAVTHGDLSAGFGGEDRGGSMGRLRHALGGAMRRLREERAQSEESSRFYAGLVEDAPTALLTVDRDGRVETANTAARRLFARHDGVRVDDFAVYGPSLVAALKEENSSGRLVTLATDIGPQQAMLRSAAMNRLGRSMRVVAVQPIQAALNAVELAAQSDLIRVLTHEIMNSMTPVTSLARTAAGLIATVDDGRDPALSDARMAVDTLARRADGVLQFVGTYRQISRPVRVDRRRFAAAPFAQELRRLFEADGGGTARLDVSVTPADLALDADPDLLAQVLINLLRNAAEACPRDDGVIGLELAAGPAGSGRVIVTDNGPGVPEAKRPDVFLPFYTTKPSGTGVGLSFARQVMLAHDGTIALDDAPGGGARFTLLL